MIGKSKKSKKIANLRVGVSRTRKSYVILREKDNLAFIKIKQKSIMITTVSGLSCLLLSTDTVINKMDTNLTICQ